MPNPDTQFVWQRRTNQFKQRLGGETPPLTMWVTIPWHGVVEMAGALGVDAIFIDLEHSSFSLTQAVELIMAAQLASITPFVRPHNVEPHEISRVLDAGVGGVIFPNMESGESARLARQSMKHAPDGCRGWGGWHTRHAVWEGEVGLGALRQAGDAYRGVYSTEYVEKAAADVLTVFGIELVAGVNNVDEILDMGKPDLVGFGWGDFSAEVRFDVKRCDEAYEIVHAACRKRGIGIAVSQRDTARYYPGCYTSIGVDSLLLSQGIRHAVTDVLSRFAAPRRNPTSEEK